MIAFVFTFVLIALVCLALFGMLAVAGLSWAGATELVRSTPPRLRIPVVLALGLAIFLTWQQVRFYHAREAVPDALQVTSLLYAKEDQRFGLFRRNDERGLRVFEINPQVAARIKAEGLRFFATMPFDGGLANDGSVEKWRNGYDTWLPTPVASDVVNRMRSEPRPLELDAFLNWREGPLAIEPGMAQRVKRILQSPGSFYAHGGGGGVLIVSPGEQLAIYVHNSE